MGPCPGLASAHPYPQGGARCSGLGLPQCPQLLSLGWGGWMGPGYQAMPCHPKGAYMVLAPRELLAQVAP